MLIDFSVENYRSIKDLVKLSALTRTHAANDQDNRITKPYLFPARNLEVLPVIGIFGANASGKSNIIRALDGLLSFVVFSNLDANVYRGLSFVVPFKLDSTSISRPTKFELRVLAGGHIYIYQLHLDHRRIMREKLSYIPKTSTRAVARLIFHREWNDDLGNYSVRNGKDIGDAFKKIQLSLTESQTFLGLFLRSLDVVLLAPLTSWLRLHWTGVSLRNETFDRYMACSILKSVQPHLHRRVKQLLHKFDTGIDDVEIRRDRADQPDGSNYEVWITHKSKGKRTRWLIEEESLGTQRLFELGTKLAFVIEHGGIMLVDELGFGTHPQINVELVRLFQDNRINKNGAQLIFTSHDSSLLRKGVLRRDQICFTEKRRDGSTDLYSLADFGTRADLIVDKAYLDGRFGAVPFLPDKEGLSELFGVS